MGIPAKQTNNWLMKIIAIFVSIGLSVSGWFINEASGRITKCENSISSLVVDSKDLVKREQFIDYKDRAILKEIELNSRTVVLEQNLKFISDTLKDIKNTNGRVEQKLDEHIQKTNQ